MPPLNASAVAMARVDAFWRGEKVDASLHLCLNRCRQVRNGKCDDKSSCREGMDCSDCGVRSYRQPPVGRSPRRRAAWRRWVSPSALSDVCLCTLMTADRIPSLHRLARSWGHYLSVAYLADAFEADAARGFDLLKLEGQPMPHADMLTLSVVEDRGYRQPLNRFPFNLLRNVAVAASPVDFVCLVDVDFVAYPLPTPSCATCHAAARLRRWLPLLRLTPHLALVLPAFEARASSTEGAAAMRRVRSKRDVAARVRGGLAEAFAFSQYPLGHACDEASRWLSERRPYLMSYQFGCEPYVLYNRRTHGVLLRTALTPPAHAARLRLSAHATRKRSDPDVYIYTYICNTYAYDELADVSDAATEPPTRQARHPHIHTRAHTHTHVHTHSQARHPSCGRCLSPTARTASRSHTSSQPGALSS